LLDVSHATLYRHRLPRLFGPVLAPVAGLQPTALTSTERAHALHILNGDRFADKSPAQVWVVLLDEGAYLTSVSTLQGPTRGLY
jgi:putative transposase